MVDGGVWITPSSKYTCDLAMISHYNPGIRHTYMGTKHLDATVSWTRLPLFGFFIGKIVSDFFFCQ